MREEHLKPKKPKESSRIIRALKGKAQTAIGPNWEGMLIEWVKGVIQPAIKKPRHFDSYDYAERLEKRAWWVVKTYAKVVEDDKNKEIGGKIEI